VTGSPDQRRFAPAIQRNRDPILAGLRPLLPAAGRVLEIASGSGEHIVHFAGHWPALEWQPSDPSPEARGSITAWSAGLGNILSPIALDAAQDHWPIERADAVLCINMIHISPWEATIGLMRGAGRILPAGGPLFLYGPYRRAGRPLEPGNAAFDEDLRARDPRWGLRDLDAVIACAAGHGLRFEQTIEMPANNLSVVFRKA
jgi:SAM-dependent methyltransferase